ncbi:trypsin-like peptidase domain-containing protein [Amycolatopsis sp. NPDC005232]|uniref:trypsin-like peptidase domain-containing protein n=1 Tax=Amycolatopsis sp. NPDC005232 TaxID=3157027 RepID=UPI0033B84F89
MPDQRADLADALRAATVPLRIPGTKVVGTGFFVAPGLVLTCAHVVTVDHGPAEVVVADDPEGGEFEVLAGTYVHGGAAGADLVLLKAPAARGGSPVLLSSATAPGDELWAFGYPEGNYRAGEPIALSLDGTSEHVAGPALLKATQGRIQPGLSGGPVLNWRTGAVCGVVRYRDRRNDDTARFIPVDTMFATYPELASGNGAGPKAWLDLATDAQLAAAQVRYPGPRLRRYLRAASAADENHPYAGLLEVRPPLSKVYLRQQMSGGEDSPLAEADDLVRRHAGLQILGGPGAGKSSLVRHLTAVVARRWLEAGTGDYVPILVPAEALSRFGGGLADLLAEGVVRVLHTDLDRVTLVSLFSEPPFAGGEWLVFVDGVDEVLDPSTRNTLLAKIARHRIEGHYRFALTTRPLPGVSLEKVTGDGSYPTFTIEPFGAHELDGFAVNWFAQLGLADPEVAGVQFRRRIDDAGIGHLATIPLIATMMCILFAAQPARRLPGNRAELYGRFVDHLLVKRKFGEARDHLLEWTKRSGAQAETAADELLARTPELLEVVAYEEYAASADVGSHRYRPDPVAVLAQRVPQPVNMTGYEWEVVLREVLRNCGLFVEHRGRFTFIHQTIQEYLAAAYLVRRRPDPRRITALRLVGPQEWPWRGLEVKVFLAGLWAARGRDLERLLMRLLNRRNRDQNYRYVVELHRQQVELPPKVAAKLRALLTSWISDDNLGTDSWGPAVDALTRLDPGLAAKVLGGTAAAGHRSQRRLDAALLLADLDPPPGLQALEDLARNEDSDGSERLRAAKVLLEKHERRGLVALTGIAGSVSADEYRVEAALIATVADAARAQELLESIAYDTRAADQVRLSAARSLGPRSRSVALTRLAGEQGVDARIRLGAAAALDAQGDATGLALLLGIARDPAVAAGVRLEAGDVLARNGHHEAEAAYSAIATARNLPADVRAQAAESASVIDPAAVEMQLDLIADPAMGDARIMVALSAGRIAAEAAAAAVARLVQPAEDDFELLVQAAAAAAELHLETGVAVLGELAGELYLPRVRLEAARLLVQFDEASGTAALFDLAEQRWAGATVRAAAAEALWLRDRPVGHELLIRLFSSHTSGIGEQVARAVRISRTDRSLGIDLLRSIGLNAAARPVERIAAQRELGKLNRRAAELVNARLEQDPAVVRYRERR